MRGRDWVALFLTGVLILFYSWGCFYLGEKFFWYRFKPSVEQTINDTCVDCAKAGKDEGYTQGLNSCSDVLNNLDQDGRR